MKLYVEYNGIKTLIGEPRSQAECIEMTFADMKSKFITPRGMFKFPFQSGSTLYMGRKGEESEPEDYNSSRRYLLE